MKKLVWESLFLALVLCVATLRLQGAKAPTPPVPPASGPADAVPAAPRNPDWAVLVSKDMNLWRVTPAFYRCEQFTKAQVAELRKLGIHVSVNLRNFHSDDDELRDSGIAQVRVRINTWNVGDKAVVAALAALRRAEASGSVVLHCQHGADRTGLVTAMYRLLYQGWTKDAALDELLNGGYGFHSLWKNIPKYIRKADVEKIRKAVEEQLAAAPE